MKPKLNPAALPDLYEALTNAAKDIEIRIRRGLAEEGHTAAGIADIVDTCPALIGARAALAKARGEGL